MHRFYLPPDQSRGPELALSESDAHHAAHVLRLRDGDQVTVLDGAGGELACRILSASKHQVRLSVLERRQSTPPPARVTLFQALPKGKIIEAIIQKATELGVHRIIPLLTERVATRLDPSTAARKTDQWQSTAIEAIKQCGSQWLPKIELPIPLRQALQETPDLDLLLVASLQPGSRNARVFFDDYRREHGRSPATVGVWIGPEGDLTTQEVSDIEAAGARPITLGPLVLKVETAAVYCLSIINHEFVLG